MTRNIVIVDLDGTLCNSAHREHHAAAKEWELFHSKLKEDKPHEDVATLIKAMSRLGYRCYGLTGRNEQHRSATINWLADHWVQLDVLLMRPDNNWRPDHELKPAMLQEAFGGLDLARERVLMILEDRDKVVEAWRNLGFRCWQVQPGGY